MNVVTQVISVMLSPSAAAVDFLPQAKSSLLPLFCETSYIFKLSAVQETFALVTLLRHCPRK